MIEIEAATLSFVFVVEKLGISHSAIDGSLMFFMICSSTIRSAI